MACWAFPPSPFLEDVPFPWDQLCNPRVLTDCPGVPDGVEMGFATVPLPNPVGHRQDLWSLSPAKRMKFPWL